MNLFILFLRQVDEKLLEAGLMDLCQLSPAGPPAPAPEDSWEWDETDMTVPETEPESNPTHDRQTNPDQPSDRAQSTDSQLVRTQVRDPERAAPPHSNIFQVFSLHNVEFYQQPHCPLTKTKAPPPLKSLSKDSSLSSLESLPDLLGGLTSNTPRDGGRGQLDECPRSDSESGIVSDTGDVETTASSSDVQAEEEDEEQEMLPKFPQSLRTDVCPETGRMRRTGGETQKKKEEEQKRRRGGEAIEILVNGHGILTPADSDDDVTMSNPEQYISLEPRPPLKCQGSSPVGSQSSSLESLLALGVDLFPSRDPLHRSASLETCLKASSLIDLDLDLDLGPETRGGGESAPGELSRRTLDLLKCLENIQNPLMTRSVSEVTLGSSSPQRSLLPVSPSLGGQHPPLSGGFSQNQLVWSSEDSFSHRNRRLDPNPKSCRRSRPNDRGPGGDDPDVASLSMVVNVSCTSACTDEDEDISDLLSSSTLTLTEEELGVREEEEGEDRLTGMSSGDEEEEEDEEDMDSSYILGMNFMKKELQSWIRSPCSSSSTLLSKTEAGLWGELQCGTPPSSSFASSATKDTNNKTEREEWERKEENRRSTPRSCVSHLVEDVKNGNVDQTCWRRRDEDDELLRNESSVFTETGDALTELYLNTRPDESNPDGVHLREDTALSKPASSLVGELRGELPCHGVPLHSPPSPSVGEDCTSQHALHSSRASGGRRAINIQEKFKFSSLVTEETRREVRAKDPSPPPKKRSKSLSCCSHAPSSSPRPQSRDQSTTGGMHSFVMELIDMASVALRNQEDQTEELNPRASIQDPSPGPLAQIRDKVTEGLTEMLIVKSEPPLMIRI